MGSSDSDSDSDSDDDKKKKKDKKKDSSSDSSSSSSGSSSDCCDDSSDSSSDCCDDINNEVCFAIATTTTATPFSMANNSRPGVRESTVGLYSSRNETVCAINRIKQRLSNSDQK